MLTLRPVKKTKSIVKSLYHRYLLRYRARSAGFFMFCKEEEEREKRKMRKLPDTDTVHRRLALRGTRPRRSRLPRRCPPLSTCQSHSGCGEYPVQSYLLSTEKRIKS